MENPFLFGKTVSAGQFINRVPDIKRLKNNFTNGINTMMISPRRWGKSSLVNKTISELNQQKIKVVTIDMMRIRNEDEFYKALAAEVLKRTSNKVQEWIKTGSEFLKNIAPTFSVGSEPGQELEISFAWKSIDKNYQQILNLPERIAEKKNFHILICLDEFQNLMHFDHPLLFQKRLRSEWQHHQKVSYCLYGSSQHMLSELFNKQSNPFYKFGDVFLLQKIDRKEWTIYIVKQFESTDKEISTTLASSISGIVMDQSYYVQQLAHLVWQRTEKKVTESIVLESRQDLISQNALLYTRDTENLSANQFNFLKAIASGNQTQLSSKKLLDEFNLGTSSNMIKVKKSLIKKELIDESLGLVQFLDPVYELWFKTFIMGASQ